MSLRHALVMSLLFGACGTEAPAPDKPTWVDDVRPILQANCFHCHGGSVMPGSDNVRWDVYNIMDPKYAALGFPSNFLISASDPGHSALALGRATSGADNPGAKRMPPPPALPLDDRDLKVLANWIGSGFTPGQHQPNHKPRIVWLAKPLFEVVDDDHDQVLGQLDCSGMKIQLPYAGGYTLPSSMSPPCTARLYDGFEEGGGDLQ